ncbi:response regulator [Pseudonocardia acidicola]|uniref:Response regulator transcription factor n=1 Tax=Pseudonocardia acidicola TaxID=2724939 RepID=A0ABX1S9L5_9PSEU|nr:response regulator transcription factor [Pseudonocardia acidicola]
MIRFCVVDDHEIVHDGLRAMAAREDDLEFTGATTSPADAPALIERAGPDVLLLDLRLGEENSTDLCAELTRRFPELTVLVFSAYGNAELLSQAIRAGAAGYVLKDTSTARIPDILRELRRNGSYFDPRIAGRLLRRSASPSATPEAFGERELEIVRRIARGENNHEIGERLHISPHTVKFHVTTMLRRHELRRRAELVRLAMELHVLD